MTTHTGNQTGRHTSMMYFFTPWSVSCLLHLAVFTIFSLTQPEFQGSQKRQSRDGITVKLHLVFDDFVSDKDVQEKPNTERLRDRVQEIVEIDNDKKTGLYAKVFDKLSPLTLEGLSAKQSEEPSLQKNLISDEGKESVESASIIRNPKKSGDIDSKTASQPLNINSSSLKNSEPVLLKETKVEASPMPQEVLAELNDEDDGHEETLHEPSSKSSLGAELGSGTQKNTAAEHYSNTQVDQLEQPTSFENKDPLVPEEALLSISPRKPKLRQEKSDEVLNPAGEILAVEQLGSNKATSVTRQVKFDTKKLLDHLVPKALPKKEKVNLSLPFVGKKINESSQLQLTAQCEGLSESASTSKVVNFYAQMNDENIRVSHLLGNKFQPFIDARANINNLLGGITGRQGYVQNSSEQITISYLLMQRQLIQVNSIPCKN